MFQLTAEETEALRCQIGISNAPGCGGRRYLPYVFTEQGIAMLSGMLTSPRAIEVNVAIMRTFVRLRELLATHEELAHRLEQLEWRQSEQEGRVQYGSKRSSISLNRPRWNPNGGLDFRPATPARAPGPRANRA